MTPETVNFLLGLLERVTLSGADPDLLENAGRVARARAELETQLPSPSNRQA